MRNEKYDVVIVGGGPSGLYSSFSCGVRQLKIKLLEARPTLGGRIPLYQEQLIWDVAGSQGKLGSEIANNLVAGAKHFPADITLNQSVTKISKTSSEFVLTTQDDTIYLAKTVILAASSGIIHPRKLKLKENDGFDNLHYIATELIKFDAYVNKTVLIYGNPESLTEYAILLQKIAKTVILVTKKAHFSDVSVFLDNVIIYTNTDIDAFKSTESVISEVALSNGSRLEVSEILVHLGTKYESKAITFENFDVTMLDQNGHSFIQNNPDTSTNIAGLFVVGSLGAYEGKHYNLAACLSEATKAATQVAVYLDDTVVEQLSVSTHNEVFKTKSQAIKANYFN